MKNLPIKNTCFLPAVFLIFAASVSAFAQTENQIVKIRAEVAAINKAATKYKKTTKDVEGVSLEGTEAAYYHHAGDLKKITAKIYGESYNATGEFYYRGGELIFAFIKNNRYDVPIGGSGRAPKVVRTEEQRFYFADGELIRLLVGKKELKSTAERYVELKEQVVGISKALKEA